MRPMRSTVQGTECALLKIWVRLYRWYYSWLFDYKPSLNAAIFTAVAPTMPT